ncbi:uncharacterized protein NP_1444A [Natronomonas pharaonis DSM 2160]|uniref:DUF8009 domain-containing protein n=2 Tax=Natronomonas pharaonis TaxID=2257 RepID=A0A1U7EUZ4_NATPD|nr:uncharacterized protein NP_1444A [Natronomonas pharaonis DSM 2160]
MRQSDYVLPMTPNEGDATDGEPGKEDNTSIDDIETLVVDPDDVVQALAYNGQEEVGIDQKVSFELTPPFEAEAEPELVHIEDDTTKVDLEGAVRIRPFRFVEEGRQVVEQRPTRELALEELDAADPKEATIDEWIDEALETWKEHVREHRADVVDVYASHGMAIIDVEYTDSQES